jgi:hypothetical protein
MLFFVDLECTSFSFLVCSLHNTGNAESGLCFWCKIVGPEDLRKWGEGERRRSVVRPEISRRNWVTDKRTKNDLCRSDLCRYPFNTVPHMWVLYPSR